MSFQNVGTWVGSEWEELCNWKPAEREAFKSRRGGQSSKGKLQLNTTLGLGQNLCQTRSILEVL